MTALRAHDRVEKAPPGPVYLNHLYVVPSPDTYKAVAENEFLQKNFGASESRTTVRADKTYTGLYFYGEHTYFELLEPPKEGKSPETYSGVAFGAEAPDQVQTLAARLKESGSTNAILKPINRQTEGKAVNWFLQLILGPQFEKSKFASWLMEYNPDFLSNWYPQLPPAQASMHRSDVLERYAAKVNRSKERQQGLFLDVARIRLSLESGDAKEFEEICGIYGYQISHRRKETSCKGPEIELLIHSFDAAHPPERPGVTAIQFKLRDDKTHHQVIKLGATSQLEFKGTTADWRF
ncbi:MAG: DUF5829 family protein [Candidatus Acidiferrales bacterium]